MHQTAIQGILSRFQSSLAWSILRDFSHFQLVVLFNCIIIQILLNHDYPEAFDELDHVKVLVHRSRENGSPWKPNDEVEPKAVIHIGSCRDPHIINWPVIFNNIFLTYDKEVNDNLQHKDDLKYKQLERKVIVF